MSLRYLLLAALCAGSMSSCQSMRQKMRTAAVRNSFVYQQPAAPATAPNTQLRHDSQGPEPTVVTVAAERSATQQN